MVWPIMGNDCRRSIHLKDGGRGQSTWPRFWAKLAEQHTSLTSKPEIETDGRGGGTMTLSRAAHYSLTKRAYSPFQAEPAHPTSSDSGGQPFTSMLHS